MNDNELIEALTRELMRAHGLWLDTRMGLRDRAEVAIKEAKHRDTLPDASQESDCEQSDKPYAELSSMGICASTLDTLTPAERRRVLMWLEMTYPKSPFSF